jgi:putative drug exporter of the RND superfamily
MPSPAPIRVSWGQIVYRFRWLIVVLSAVPLVPAVWLVARGGDLETSVVPITTESGRAADLIAKELPRRPTFDLIFSDAHRRVADREFREAVERALEPLRHDPRVARVVTAYDRSPPDPVLISIDGHRTSVRVELVGRASAFESLEFSSVPPSVYESLRRLVRSETLEVVATGSPALHHDFTRMAEEDLRRCERVTLPLVLALLLVVFGSVVAALLPILVAVLAMLLGMAALLVLSHATTVSIYAGNLVTMIGLGVAVDYALFVVSRFREERPDRDVAEALARTMATAGRTIVFSGLTVAIGFAGLVLVPIGALSSLGLAGPMVVAFAVIYSVTLLPALLAILGPRVDVIRLPFASRIGRADENGVWHRTATLVMAHPWRVLLPVLALLIVLGLPFRAIRLGSADPTILPPEAESRRGDELRRQAFPGGGESQPIIVVLHTPDGPPTSAGRIGQLYDLSRWLAGLRGVTRVDSIVDLDPRIDRRHYERLAALPPSARPPGFEAAVRELVGAHVALLVVHPSFRPDSDEARALVRTIRTAHPALDGELLVTGQTAFDLDFIQVLRRSAPAAIGFIVVVTSLVLFFLLGSVLLPLKAVVMNFLSITASYGALVWIFQEGHLAGWLGFRPSAIESPIPLIMFCVLFGLSMDYEVLLLSRTCEEYERTGDNSRAVAVSLARTGRLITGAAAIMAGVFFGFGLAHAIMIKAIGIGMGIAVVVDATVVRALLVPATMRLLGRWNWWVPPFLRFGRLYR